MGARSVWKGSISVGLVNVPVSLQTATRESKMDFHQISPCCGARVSLPLKCKTCGKEVSRAEVKKGWELSEDKYVILEQTEIEAVRLKSVKTIEVEGFVPATIDPLLFNTSYYVAQVEGGEKAYNLIAEALSLARAFALARITTHGKEHIAILRTIGRNLILSLLWYPDEVLRPPEITPTPISDKERELAMKLLEAFKTEADLSKFKNRYIEALKEVINAKMMGQPLPAPKVEEAPAMALEQALMVSVKQRKKVEA